MFNRFVFFKVLFLMFLVKQDVNLARKSSSGLKNKKTNAKNPGNIFCIQDGRGWSLLYTNACLFGNHSVGREIKSKSSDIISLRPIPCANERLQCKRGGKLRNDLGVLRKKMLNPLVPWMQNAQVPPIVVSLGDYWVNENESSRNKKSSSPWIVKTTFAKSRLHSNLLWSKTFWKLCAIWSRKNQYIKLMSTMNACLEVRHVHCIQRMACVTIWGALLYLHEINSIF